MDYNFYNNWLDISNIFKANQVDHILNLPSNFFETLNFDDESLRQYRIRNANLCAETLGNNPALLLSGGIDSQAMVQCWHEANLKFDIIIFTFKNDLNIQDSNHAKEFCKVNNLPYKEIVFDVITFLNRENFDLGLKYKSASPHFNVHYRMAEILRDQGYTGICCGGFTPNKMKDIWGTNFSYNTCRYTTIHDTLGIPFQGNFLSYTPELSWAISLLTDTLDFIDRPNVGDNEYFGKVEERYSQKIDGYKRAGLNIIPQSQKFTGFELVRDYYQQLTGDGWTFEKRFRYPLINTLLRKDSHVYKFNLSDEQSNQARTIHFKNCGSTFGAAPGI